MINYVIKATLPDKVYFTSPLQLSITCPPTDELKKKGNLYYNSLRAQPGARLDVELINGLEKKGKTNNKANVTKNSKADNTKKTKKV